MSSDAVTVKDCATERSSVTSLAEIDGDVTASEYVMNLVCPPASSVAVGIVEPIPTDPTPTELRTVTTVPPVPTFSVVEVITPAVICQEEC